MLKKDDIIKLFSNSKKKLEDKYGFKTIFLYGSFAKDQATEKSDVDIAVEVFDDAYKTWDNFIYAKEELKKMTGHEIDLVYVDSLNPIIKDEVEKDFIRID